MHIFELACLVGAARLQRAVELFQLPSRLRR
jgi:hypothetical protein